MWKVYIKIYHLKYIQTQQKSLCEKCVPAVHPYTLLNKINTYSSVLHSLERRGKYN